VAYQRRRRLLNSPTMGDPMNFDHMTDAEVEGVVEDAEAELARRRTLDTAAERVAEILTSYQAAAGIQDGTEWRQPTGVLEAYLQGALVTHDGKTWESLIAMNVWEPGVSGWREVTEDGAPPAWVQPSGAHDAYDEGAQVTHDGKGWVSTTEGNVWEPGNYGGKLRDGEIE